MEDKDPTGIALEHDPKTQRMRGHATHGNTPFDVPYISHIEGNLYTGGCTTGLILPQEIEYVLSLYPWEAYWIVHPIKALQTQVAYDDDIEHLRAVIDPIVGVALQWLARGKTLIHCQAGLNRSGLIAACCLIKMGRTPQQAIDLLREKRSPAVLCNKNFEQWLLSGGFQSTV